ncbi:ryanodine receptor 2-like [Coregonus clupeaformis]|uniref:ryanodine receptor 2-like n=1 Tax=Coregonus clupeaformis TaxID=59861 RepID=UPI001BDF9E57|nr:ryanodine receptor 2-like [Coregonus clupeaformis]
MTKTNDEVVLQCIFMSQLEHLKLCLAAEGFGCRFCCLESTSSCKNVSPDLSVCAFVLAQCLSVRALQEMLANRENQAAGLCVVQAGQGGGHRTLLYGQVALLLHSYNRMYLCLSTTQSSTDKIAFDVGLQDDKTGEACWWTIHPASKQRSKGEKVRVGDDLIMVSVTSERYLALVLVVFMHNLSYCPSFIVDAAFQQTLWSVTSIFSGSGVAQGRRLDGLSQQGNIPSFNLPVETVGLSLQDLIGYFQTPGEGLGHEARQNSVRALKNRGGGRWFGP